MNDISNDSTTTTSTESSTESSRKSSRKSSTESSKETSRINRNDENNNNNNNNVKSSSSSIASTIHIISATYGPDHGRRLYNGEWSNTEYDRMPYTRDVLPFLRTMILYNKQNNSNNNDTNSMEEEDENENNNNNNTTRATDVKLIMKERSMNILFGDPCPGVTKVLRIQYYYKSNNSIRSKIFHCNYGEYEHVILHGSKRIMHTINIDTATNDNTNDNNDIELNGDTCTNIINNNNNVKWKLNNNTSEIILPMILPYLTISSKALIQSVCKTWRNIIRELGVASILDVRKLDINNNNSRSYILGILSNSYTSLHSLYINDTNYGLTQDDLHNAIPKLRQLKNLDISRCNTIVTNVTLQLISQYLYKTIQVLYIKNLNLITDDGLINIATKCNKLKILDISYCKNITDDSVKIIGHNLLLLEAFFLRDNYDITNDSIKIVTLNCKKLMQLSLWGCLKLSKLYFIHDHDNDIDHDNNCDYTTTTLNSPSDHNTSIVPTLSSSTSSTPITPTTSRTNFWNCSNIVCLNLWGCHALNDNVIHSMKHLKHLKTLIVSECHRLTDTFVINVAKYLSQIQHLHLRYLRRITDKSINAISHYMKYNMYVLDISFCTKITENAILDLIMDTSSAMLLSELKLYNCRQITPQGLYAIASYISTLDYCSLCLLDLRSCGVDLRINTNSISANNTATATATATNGNANNNMSDNIIRCLVTRMKFEHKINGFFVRNVKWNKHTEHLMFK